MSFLSGVVAGVGNVVHNIGCCHMLFSSSKRVQLSFLLPPPLTHSPNMFLVRMPCDFFLT